MKPIRSLASAVALASLLSTACLTAHAADIPLGSRAIEGHIVSRVLAVDAANYQVTIEGPDKTEVPIQLTNQAKNLHNLKVGDTVDIQVIRSVAYVLDTQVGGAPGVSNEAMTIRSTKDNPNPGGEAVRQVKVTSKITKVDLKTHEVTLMPPEGKLKVVKVEDPQLQERMKNLKVGQTVDAVYTEVLKVQTSR
jgi:Cu/Ag efflux protein CusF